MRKSISRKAMRGQQKVVVNWMRRQLCRLHWKPERWAREAGLAPTTVTRAMAENYDSVSSVLTLHALAVAAKVPSVLDFLDGRAGVSPKPQVLAAILGELLPAVGCDLGAARLEMLGGAMAQVLAGLSELPDACGVELDSARVLAQAARSVIHEKG